MTQEIFNQVVRWREKSRQGSTSMTDEDLMKALVLAAINVLSGTDATAMLRAHAYADVLISRHEAKFNRNTNVEIPIHETIQH